VGAGNYLLVGMVDGDLVTIDVSGSGTFDTKNVGTGKVVTIGGVALGEVTDGGAVVYGYQLGSSSASGAVGTITPATLTYVADPANRPYGSANPVFGGTVTGFLGADTLGNATTGLLTFTTSATTGSNIGIYAILGSGLTATDGNYVFVQAAGNATALTINPASLVITADDVSKLYGALLPTFTASYDGLVNGDTTAVVSGLTLTTTASAGSNVGTYTITAGGATASNYAITFEPGTLTINPASLVITADDVSKLYGALLPTFTASYDGLVNGDTTAVVSGLTLTTAATAGSNVGTYTITAGGATASNYAITFEPGTLTINPASLVITADDVSKLYGALLPTFTASYDGLVNGDTTAVVSGLTLTTTASAGSNVGTYTITAGGATASNYAITFEPGTLTINPASLVITANDATREAGADNPLFTASFDGLVNGDTSSAVDGLIFDTSATTGSLIGSYAIVPSGATASNYTITFTAGTLTVVPPVVIVDGLSIPVSTLDGQSLISSGYAVVSRGRSNRFVSLSGRVAVGTSVDQGLGVALAPAMPWFGEPAGFSLLPVDGDGAASQPGTGEELQVRETSTDRGRFRVIYREALTQERALATGNTATGSSYRDFDGARPPQVRLLRAAPSDSSSTPPATSL
jgi:hypothetical protein